MRWLTLCAIVLAIGCDGNDPITDAGPDDGGLLDAGPEDVIEIRILALNDLHGRLEAPEDGSNGGAGHLARLVQELRAEQPNTILVGAGDMIGGSAPLSGLLHDEPTIAVMNEIGFDAVSVGNHEFDRPFDELQRVLGGGCHTDGCILGATWDGSSFPWLGANVLDSATGEPVLPEYEIIEVGGLDAFFPHDLTRIDSLPERYRRLRSQTCYSLVPHAKTARNQVLENTYQSSTIDVCRMVP